MSAFNMAYIPAICYSVGCLRVLFAGPLTGLKPYEIYAKCQISERSRSFVLERSRTPQRLPRFGFRSPTFHMRRCPPPPVFIQRPDYDLLH